MQLFSRLLHQASDGALELDCCTVVAQYFKVVEAPLPVSVVGVVQNDDTRDDWSDLLLLPSVNTISDLNAFLEYTWPGLSAQTGDEPKEPVMLFRKADNRLCGYCLNLQNATTTQTSSTQMVPNAFRVFPSEVVSQNMYRMWASSKRNVLEKRSRLWNLPEYLFLLSGHGCLSPMWLGGGSLHR